MQVERRQRLRVALEGILEVLISGCPWRDLQTDLVREWDPDAHPELAQYIEELAEELEVEPPPSHVVVGR